jgi:hypothetical protein
MTPKCLDTSRDLQEFFKSGFCDSVTTEVVLHAWISLNDAIDIRSMLWSMAHSPEKLYGADVIAKLKAMDRHQKQEASVRVICDYCPRCSKKQVYIPNPYYIHICTKCNEQYTQSDLIRK